jgi:mannose-6-phosphate isomerase
MELLQPVIRPYAWGSRHAIAELQGRPVPAPGPEAELWMGAHPSAPSGAAGTTLDAVIAADPDRELGPRCVARFGPRLPFLLKVLSAEVALSIQLHPSRAQAEAGFRAETARRPGRPDRQSRPGRPDRQSRPRRPDQPRRPRRPDQPRRPRRPDQQSGLAPAGRNYVDDWPKPELLCALTPFEVLAGLRTPSDAAALLRALAVDQLAPLAAELDAATGPQALASALATVLTWPDPEDLVAAVVAACASLASSAGPYAAACAAAVREAGNHPGDLGVVAMLLMRYAVLAPGQAVFMPAGGLHTYLRGTGVEVLANSDNVVRAGLTSKHVDVPELLKLLDPAAAIPILSPTPLAAGISYFDTPAPEFRLYVADLAERAVTLPGAGPRIVLCTTGAALLRNGSGEAVKLARGESCFIPAADGPLQASAADAPVRLFLAAPEEPATPHTPQTPHAPAQTE